jgi:hypothetical protein
MGVLMTFTEKVEILKIQVRQKLTEKLSGQSEEKIEKIVNRVMEHQQGTASVLKRRGLPEYLIDAGLYHGLAGQSRGGIAGGEVSPIFTREEITNIIGEQATEVIYIYCYTPWLRAKHIDKMPPSQLKNDLVQLDIADAVDSLVAGWDQPRMIPEFIDSLFDTPHMVHYNISDEELSDMTKTWETNMKNQPNLKMVNKNY